MNWLARLKKKNPCLTTDPTKPTEVTFVGSVGSHAAPFSQSGSGIETKASNDLDMPAILQELSVSNMLDAHKSLFIARGLSTGEVESAALMLKHRDDDRDERRLCLECAHMYGSVDARRCSQWQQLGDPSPAIPADLVSILRRCQSFQLAATIDKFPYSNAGGML